MIITTTSTLQNREIASYLGVVSGEAIIGANALRDLFASIRDVVGGRSASYEKVIREAKEICMREMQEKAEEMGANAIIAVDLDYESIRDGMLMVVASGTAVKIVE